MKILRILFHFVFVVLMSFLLWNAGDTMYGIAQLKGQLNIIYNTIPVNQVKGLDAVRQKKLELIDEIRNYAFDSLGLEKSENYTTFFDQKKEPILWVVTASEPFEMNAYKWDFPFLGKVSYKGFFKKDKAQKEAGELLKKSYDVDIGRVGGWSTLGYLTDPVLSGMLEYSEGSLSNLIIHELTHGTLFVKNDVNFNENLASFIGDKGGMKFMLMKYGEGSKELTRFLNDKADEKVYDKYALRCAAILDSLYNTQGFKILTRDDKLRVKRSYFKNFADGISELPLNNKLRYLHQGKRMVLSQNAYLMNFVRYSSKQNDFETEFNEKFNGDIKSYIHYLKEKYPRIN